jgi:hypothetical protein
MSGKRGKRFLHMTQVVASDLSANMATLNSKHIFQFRIVLMSINHHHYFSKHPQSIWEAKTANWFQTPRDCHPSCTLESVTQLIAWHFATAGADLLLLVEGYLCKARTCHVFNLGVLHGSFYMSSGLQRMSCGIR